MVCCCCWSSRRCSWDVVHDEGTVKVLLRKKDGQLIRGRKKKDTGKRMVEEKADAEKGNK
jgi:hypothetical protein